MWPRFGDMLVIYSGLTPLCVMYWHATFKLLDHYVADRMNMLIIGYSYILLVLILHDTFRCVEEIFVYKCIYQFIYDYLIFGACLMYLHGCNLLYEICKQTLPPVGIAACMAILLIILKGFRNVLALPFVVNNDELVDRYRPHNTLHFFNRAIGIL